MAVDEFFSRQKTSPKSVPYINMAEFCREILRPLRNVCKLQSAREIRGRVFAGNVRSKWPAY